MNERKETRKERVPGKPGKGANAVLVYISACNISNKRMELLVTAGESNTTIIANAETQSFETDRISRDAAEQSTGRIGVVAG